jgi:hypothetical protein
MRPSQAILVLEDLRLTITGPLYRKGVELSSKDGQTVLDVYQQWLLLMIDLGYLHHGSLERDARRLWTDMVQKDVLDLNNAFTDLLHLTRNADSRGFKALCRMISSHLYSFIREDILLIQKSDVFAARRLMQLFSYTSRLTLHDIDLTEECLRDYVDVEENFSSYIPTHLSTALNSIVKKWLKPFEPENLTFRHGPGGVAGHGRVSHEVKYLDLNDDTLLRYAFPHYQNSGRDIRSSMDRISQTIFVPKSYKTFRTISMEPSSLQYVQQGVWGEIDRVVARSNFLRNRIGFHEQERNQKLAREGSLNRNYATIDLSAASDSVSYELVKRVFRGTKLLRFLVASRSKRTLLPDGRLMSLKKFAPMGSSLCFPVETIIFAAVCQFVTREHDVYGDFSVFGDDIIVPTQCAEDVMTVLDSLGFKSNRSKSFFSSTCWFRESCGAEYVDGFDVTPMRVSRKYNHNARLIQLGGLIDLANAAYNKGFRYLRSFFLRRLRDADYTALFSPTSVLSDNYTNFHTVRRWNRDLQRIECRVTTLASSPPKDTDESIRLRHWFESTSNRISIGDGFVSNIDQSIVFDTRRWLEKPYEGIDQPFIDYFTIEG